MPAPVINQLIFRASFRVVRVFRGKKTFRLGCLSVLGFHGLRPVTSSRTNVLAPYTLRNASRTAAE
jgi:hypothetical protein